MSEIVILGQHTGKSKSGGNYRHLRVDSSTEALQTITYEHHETHAGSHYFVKTYVVDTGGNGAVTRFAFTTPAGPLEIHAKARIITDVDYTSVIYEGASISGGTPVTGFNNNRNSTRAANLVPVAAPTVSSTGTAMWSSRLGGGRAPTGVAKEFGYEIIAKYETTYLFEITKNIVNSGIIDVDFWWYEHTPKN